MDATQRIETSQVYNLLCPSKNVDLTAKVDSKKNIISLKHSNSGTGITSVGGNMVNGMSIFRLKNYLSNVLNSDIQLRLVGILNHTRKKEN